MHTVDARTLPCPQPVLMTRNALDSTAPGEELEILVGNETAFANVSRLLGERSVEFSAEPVEGGKRIRLVNPGSCCADLGFAAVATLPGTRVIVLKQEWMGHGSEELGRLLIKGFLNTLPDTRPLPDSIICYNAGVRFAVEDSPVLESLQRLEIAGVKIWLCGTCVDYYALRDQIRVGTVTNMLRIIELLGEASTVVFP